MKPYIKTFNEYLTERLSESLISSEDMPPKIQILLRGNIGLTGKTENFTKRLMNKIYDKYIHMVLIKEDDKYNRNSKIPEERRWNKFDPSLPVLNFTSRHHKFLDEAPEIFNRIDDYPIAADKKLFHKKFKELEYVPKAVFTIDDIQELQLPLIAKPKNGFSAQGIEVFDTYEAAQESDREFDLWSEKKEIDTEFRAFIMDGKIIHIAERITNTQNDMSVDKKDPEEKIDLIYIDQDMDKFPHLDVIKDILKGLSKSVKLDFYNIDLMLDKDGNMWVPEINGAPGIGPSMVYPIYKAWLTMAHGIELDIATEADLVQIATEHREMMKKTYPKEYKSSVYPI